MTVNRPPDNYYLDHFSAMMQLVSERYGDLLSDEDINFLTRIKKTSPTSLRLLVRLYMRKGPYFQSAKLTYAEIPDTQSAISELLGNRLLTEDPICFAYEVAELVPIAQSRILFDSHLKEKKADLVERLLESDELKTFTNWGVTEQIVSPTDYDIYRRFQLYYFGSERQTLTDFILEDIGLFKYERYPLERDNRLFNDKNEIDLTIEINDLATEFYLLNEAKDWQHLPQLAIQALEIKPPATLHRRWHRLLNRIAFRLELNGELDLADRLFQTNDRPLARERRTRILFKKENYQAALNLLNKIKENPKSNQELAFYNRFINKLASKLSLPKLTILKPTFAETHRTWAKTAGTIEQQACEHITGCEWVENTLPMAIFGLIHWKIIFADMPGVWHHPFQSGPTDLYDSEFTAKRQLLIENLHGETKDYWRTLLIEHLHEKQGIRNPFVNWNAVGIKLLAACFDSLTREQWLGIFKHLLTDLKQHRSGFPDLFQIIEDDYRFIEIKGPGDKLQDNQIHWLTKFNELGIKAEVCYVRYEQENE